MQTVLASSATGGEGGTQERAEEADFMKSFSMLDPQERAELLKTMLENLAANNTRKVVNSS